MPSFRIRLAWRKPSPRDLGGPARAGSSEVENAWSQSWESRFHADPLLNTDVAWMLSHPDERFRRSLVRHPLLVSMSDLAPKRWKPVLAQLIQDEIGRADAEGIAWTPLLAEALDREIGDLFEETQVLNEAYQTRIPEWIESAEPDELVAALEADAAETLSDLCPLIVEHARAFNPSLIEELLVRDGRGARVFIENLRKNRDSDHHTLTETLLDMLERRPPQEPRGFVLDQAATVLAFAISASSAISADQEARILALFRNGSLSTSEAGRAFFIARETRPETVAAFITEAGVAGDSLLEQPILSHMAARHPGTPLAVLRELDEADETLIEELMGNPTAVADSTLRTKLIRDLQPEMPAIFTLMDILPPDAWPDALPHLARRHPQALMDHLDTDLTPLLTLSDEQLAYLLSARSAALRRFLILCMPELQAERSKTPVTRAHSPRP